MKNEAHYEYPVNLYISKSYDDAETAQEFIKALAGEQLSVSKGRNGDYLYVSIEGSDEEIDAFLDVYKDKFTDIVWNCDADANGWVKPKDVYDSIGQDGKVLPEESKVGEGRGNEDYLQEVWDSLAVAWDKDKFNMGKGYDSEYECECITVTSKDNEEVRAKIYVEDYNGRHPAAFNVVYRYPGDKGVGVMGTYEFQSTDMDGLGEEVFDYFDEIKQKVGESMNNESFDMSRALFDAKKAITDWTKNQKHKTLEWIYTDGRKSPTAYPSGIWDFEWDTGNGMATAEIKVSPYETHTNSWNDRLDFALKSGPEGKYMYYTSAEDVLYALDKLIRDTEFKGESKKSESDKTSWALEYLVKIAKQKGLKVSWEGANEICITVGTVPHQDHIFVTDDALGKVDTSLELYVPAAHINAFGLTLQDVLDYLDDPIGKRDAVQFKNGNRLGKVEAKKSEGLPPKRLGSKRQYRSRADLINKMKQLGAVEITTSKQFNDIKNSQWLHTAGYALDTNGNLVAQSYYGDKDGKWYYTSTRNFDSDYLPESKQHENRTKEEEVTNIFKGMKDWADRWSNSDRDRKTIADNLDLEAVQENMSDIVEILDNNFEWNGYGFKFVVYGDYEDDDTRDEADANHWNTCYGVCEEIADLIGIPDEGHTIGEMNIYFWEEIEADWRDDDSKSAESKQSEAARGLFDISNAKEIITGGDRYNPVKSVEDEIAWNAYCNGGNRKILRDCLNDYYGSALCMDLQMIYRLLETYPDELRKLYNACISELTIRDSEWLPFDKLSDSKNSWQAEIFFEWIVQNVARRLLRYADESKKSEAKYDRPVTLYATTRYTDAEEARRFIRSITNDNISVSTERNGDTVSVSIEGSDEDIDAFLEVYTDNYVFLESDCDVDVNGWTDPMDLKYYTVQGRNELTGESESKQNEKSKAVCAVCGEPTDDPVFDYGHTFCKDCYGDGWDVWKGYKANANAKFVVGTMISLDGVKQYIREFRPRTFVAQSVDTGKEVTLPRSSLNRARILYDPRNESKKSESLTLKQKELKDMARYGEAEDITTISDAEAKELKKKGIETVGISRGVYGMNGALLRDNEGNKYVITARSSNLFYFV